MIAASSCPWSRPDAFPAARRAGIAAARPEHAVLVFPRVPGRARQAAAALSAGAAAHRSPVERVRQRLGRVQQRLDAPHAADAVGRAGRRRPGRGRLVPGELQPPELGRRVRAAGRAARPHSTAQVLPEAAAHLRAGDRACLVGAGLPVHAAARQGGAAAQPAAARAGPRSHAARLPQVLAGPDQRDEFRRTMRRARPTATCSSPRPARSR
jgi:hypothetical protein